MKIIAATNNANKVREFREILQGFEIVTQKEAGVDIEVEETGTTFEENSYLKAKAIYDATGFPVIADDSGLEVDALDGAPGVYSARYGGEGLDDNDRMMLLLENMKDIPDGKRSARFVCVITMVSENEGFSVRGECEGEISREPAGENGFGYDPVFFVREFGKTTAQMMPDEKNAISHRGKALREFAEKLKK